MRTNGARPLSTYRSAVYKAYGFRGVDHLFKYANKDIENG